LTNQLPVNIKTLDDLRRLEGFMIRSITVKPGTPPLLTMILSHVAAESQIEVYVTPMVKFGLSGNLMTANVDLLFHFKAHQEG